MQPDPEAVAALEAELEAAHSSYTSASAQLRAAETTSNLRGMPTEALQEAQQAMQRSEPWEVMRLWLLWKCVRGLPKRSPGSALLQDVLADRLEKTLPAPAQLSSEAAFREVCVWRDCMRAC